MARQEDQIWSEHLTHLVTPSTLTLISVPLTRQGVERIVISATVTNLTLPQEENTQPPKIRLNRPMCIKGGSKGIFRETRGDSLPPNPLQSILLWKNTLFRQTRFPQTTTSSRTLLLTKSARKSHFAFIQIPILTYSEYDIQYINYYIKKTARMASNTRDRAKFSSWEYSWAALELLEWIHD